MPSILDTLNRPHRGKYKPYPRKHPADIIARWIEVDPETGCHTWTGRLNNMGYGLMTVAQAGYKPLTLSPHKVAYELRRGRVPEGMVLDHTCRNRACANPEHLETVVQRENVMRSPIAEGALNAAKTHCPQGHPYSAENTYVYHHASPKKHTSRTCKTCRREYARQYQARKRAEVAA